MDDGRRPAPLVDAPARSPAGGGAAPPGLRAALLARVFPGGRSAGAAHRRRPCRVLRHPGTLAPGRALHRRRAGARGPGVVSRPIRPSEGACRSDLRGAGQRRHRGGGVPERQRSHSAGTDGSGRVRALLGRHLGSPVQRRGSHTAQGHSRLGSLLGRRRAPGLCHRHGPRLQCPARSRPVLLRSRLSLPHHRSHGVRRLPRRLWPGRRGAESEGDGELPPGEAARRGRNGRGVAGAASHVGPSGGHQADPARGPRGHGSPEPAAAPAV